MTHTEVVVITGCSAGVGRAVAREFARHGAKIGLLARNEDRLESVRIEVENAGGSALVLPTDVSDAGRVEEAANKVEEAFGPIDVWVNGAMVTLFAMLPDITPDEFRRATEVTYLGTVYGTMAALRRMEPRNRGVVVQVGSALGYRAIPLQAPYCGAKFAIRGFTQAVRCELLHKKSRVRIAMVQLPAVNTPQFSWCRAKIDRHPRPVAPVYQPEVIARAVYWMAHRNRRELFLGISSAVLIPVNRVIPGLLDRYMAKTAVSGQKTARPLETERSGNLFESVDGDYKVHGIFDDEAHGRSIQFWLSAYRGWIGLAILLMLIAWGVW